MVKLKKYRVHKAICDICNGNGYVKVVHVDQKNHVHQCWECDRKESFMYMNPKWLQMMFLITVVVLLTSSCTEFAILSSGTGIAVSQNVYAKVYSGIDFLTIVRTEKDIKTHIYHSLKKEEDER